MPTREQILDAWKTILLSSAQGDYTFSRKTDNKGLVSRKFTIKYDMDRTMAVELLKFLEEQEEGETGSFFDDTNPSDFDT